MKYETRRMLCPPRPLLFNVSQLEGFDETWVAQLKLNGSRCLVVVSPDKEIEFWNRHRQVHSFQAPLKLQQKILRVCKGRGYYILDGELLHNKHPKYRHTLVLYDALVINGVYQYGQTYLQRYTKLKRLLGSPRNLHKERLGFVVNRHLLLAKNYRCTDLVKLFESRTKHPIVEGLVMKQKQARLGYHFNTDKCDWMGKVRRPHKNYLF